MSRTARTPGEASEKDGITALSNTNLDPNEIARQRERIARTLATVAAGGEPELAPMPAIDAGPAIETREFGGKAHRVHVPSRTENNQVQIYGKEVSLAEGTVVSDAAGTPCEPGKKRYGVVGRILTDDGWLVGRVIPDPVANPDDREEVQA